MSESAVGTENIYAASKRGRCKQNVEARQIPLLTQIGGRHAVDSLEKAKQNINGEQAAVDSLL